MICWFFDQFHWLKSFQSLLTTATSLSASWAGWAHLPIGITSQQLSAITTLSHSKQLLNLSYICYLEYIQQARICLFCFAYFDLRCWKLRRLSYECVSLSLFMIEILAETKLHQSNLYFSCIFWGRKAQVPRKYTLPSNLRISNVV